MKKIMLALFATIVTSSVMAEVSPFVRLEREVNNSLNRTQLGVDASFGGVGVTSNYSWSSTNSTKFTGEKVEVDLSYDLNKNFGVYMQNDLTTSFRHSSTVIGGKFSF